MASARLIRTASRRGPSREQTEEERPLLQDTEGQAVDVADNEPRCPNPFADLPVYETIWRIRREVIANIQDPYSLEQLKSPRLNTQVVRPLMNQLYNLDDVSIVYCLLVNRVEFLREQSYRAHYQSVNTARALLCELVAMKLLRVYDEESTGRKGLLLLSNILIAGFEPFQNCPTELAEINPSARKWAIQDRGGYERQMTALEIAIISESKHFLSSPACQKVVDAIYIGRVVYTPTSFLDIIPDHYKRKPITIYDPRKAPLLNTYRLVVPRTRNILEVAYFIILLTLYIVVMITREPSEFTIAEKMFCIYTFGWILDQTASILEHGWQVYSQNLWSFLDVAFSIIYLLYFCLRMHGLATGKTSVSQPALDVLAMAAPILVPRLAFNIFSENIIFVALRDMMAKFFLLIFLVVWTFAGFFMSMTWLGNGYDKPIDIGKWMIWVWFGLDGTGIQRSVDFHWLLGPVLMISFAVIGNTLFLTILVSTLSNIFSNILNHSTAEIQFRRAVLTFEGVKSDAIFAYPPPFNIVALIILLTLKFFLNERWFHKVNIATVRTLNAPLLLLISFWERQNLWARPRDEKRALRLRKSNKFIHFSRFHVHGDIKAVFENPPPNHPEDNADGSDNAEDYLSSNQPSPSRSSSASVQSTKHDQTDSRNKKDNDLDVDNPDLQPPKRQQSHLKVPISQSQSQSPTRSSASRSQPSATRAQRSPSRNQSLSRTSSHDNDNDNDNDNANRTPSESSTRLIRRDTVWSEHGLESQVANYLADRDEDMDMQDLPARLARVEESVRRMEAMLKRVCDTFDDDLDGAGEGDERGDGE